MKDIDTHVYEDEIKYWGQGIQDSGALEELGLRALLKWPVVINLNINYKQTQEKLFLSAYLSTSWCHVLFFLHTAVAHP